MEELTIEEIVFLWTAKYKYDHRLHGFKFEGDPESEGESPSSPTPPDNLKETYKDLL